MQRILFFIGLLTFCLRPIAAQDFPVSLETSSSPEHYINIELKSSQSLGELSERFSVDKVVFNEVKSCFEVRLWLDKSQYSDFVSLKIPYIIYRNSTAKADVQLASSYSDLISEWTLYPTYQAYLETMATFQSQFPEMCRIDTILSATPNHHKILVARIGSSLDNASQKPSFLYTSTMHGDEVTGYYLMLRLIHYILHNQQDAKVARILEEVDLWICPLENPDGTYYSGDNRIGDSPISRRANANGYDLNRNYPRYAATIGTGYQPEIQAMMDFMSSHSFVMSANLHGGAELYNYPWDAYRSTAKYHPDTDWWELLGRSFADTCHMYNNLYFRDENNGVTNGGDWYVITGSRQDYVNYFTRSREATLELSTDKVVANNRLPDYWNYTKNSLLNMIMEVTYGLHGTVKDSVTGEPLQAKVWIENHDQEDQMTNIYSSLSGGMYHRPLKEGTYRVTYSAEGYGSQTHNITIEDRQNTEKLIWLSRPNSIPAFDQPQIRLYPNPASDYVIIEAKEELRGECYMMIYSSSGQLVLREQLASARERISLQQLKPGAYYLQLSTQGDTFVEKLLVR